MIVHALISLICQEKNHSCRFRCFLSISLLFLALILNTLFFPKQTYAQEIENWGTNVVCYGNETMFEEIRNRYGGDKWYPVTILFYVYRNDQETVKRIEGVLEAANKHRMFPIMRIASDHTGSHWLKLDFDVVAGVLNQVDTAQFNFPKDKLYVIYGNEPNMGPEWGGTVDPEGYRKSFNNFVNKLDTSRYEPYKASINSSHPPNIEPYNQNPAFNGVGGQEFYYRMGRNLQTAGLAANLYDLEDPDNPGSGVPFIAKSPYPYQNSYCAQHDNEIMNIPNYFEIEKCLNNAVGYEIEGVIAPEFGLGPEYEVEQRKQYLRDIYAQNPDAYPGITYTTPMLLNNVRSDATPEERRIPRMPVFKAGGGVDFIDCIANKELCGGPAACSGSFAANLYDYMTVPLIFNPDQDPSLERQLLESMVIDQGYEAACAGPALKLSPEEAGKLADYFTHNQDNPRGEGDLWFVAGDSFDIDLSEATIPMYRNGDQQSATSKTESYEGFFGNPQGNSSGDPVYAGVVSNLLSSEQQCLLKKQNLAMIAELCNKMQEPEKCAMHTPISGSKYFIFSTPEQNGLQPSLLNTIDQLVLTCQDLSTSWNEDLGVERETFLELKTAIHNTPFDFGKLYRYAFLVISPQQEGDVDEVCQDNPDWRTDPFWFLHKKPEIDSDQGCDEFNNRPGLHNPIVIAFKIPTFGTNKILSLPLYDSGELTANILDQLKKNNMQEEGEDSAQSTASFVIREKVEEERHDRAEFLSKAYYKWNIYLGGSNEEKAQELVVNCNGMNNCSGAHGSGTELVRVLTHIINAKEQTCLPPSYSNSPPNNYIDVIYDKDNPDPEAVFEWADTVGSSADYQPQENFFLEEHFNTNKSSLNEGVETWKWGLLVDKEKAQQIKNENDTNLEQPVLAHIVAPLGTDLTYLETMLSSLFEPDQLERMIKNNELVDASMIENDEGEMEYRTGDIARYLPITGADFSYESIAMDDNRYPHVDDCECEIEIICLLWNSSSCYDNHTDDCECLVEEESCKMGVINWPNGSGEPEPLKQSCAQAEVGFEDNFEDNDTDSGFVIKGAKLGWFIRKIQQNLTSRISSRYEYLASCERIEDLLTGRCGDPGERLASVDKYKHTDRSEAPSSCVYEGQMMRLPSECELVAMIEAKAQEYSLDPSMLWGLLKIEGTTMMNKIQKGESSMQCVINNCGAVGPMQIIQGACVNADDEKKSCEEMKEEQTGLSKPNYDTDGDGEPDYDSWEEWVRNTVQTFERDVNPCDIEEAIDWTADRLDGLKTQARNKINPEGEDWEADLNCRLAGYHFGDASCSPLSLDYRPACEGQSYCQCACEETIDIGSYNVDEGGSYENIRKSCGL